MMIEGNSQYSKVTKCIYGQVDMFTSNKTMILRCLAKGNGLFINHVHLILKNDVK